jgi:O-acetyl-ADP-ribose deacetylase (regulator of RNase III)
MIYVKGDLLQLAHEGQFDAIAHGANCFHTMGAGIAGQIARDWPEVLASDKRTEYGTRAKLGGAIRDRVSRLLSSRPLDIYTLYTQHRPGRNLDLKALEEAFATLASMLVVPTHIGLPKIGAGIAGGNWAQIEPIIARALVEHHVTVVEYHK